LRAVGKCECGVEVAGATIDNTVFGAGSYTWDGRRRIAGSYGEGLREFAVKIIVTVAGIANEADTSNDNIGRQRIAGTVGAVGNGADESAGGLVECDSLGTC